MRSTPSYYDRPSASVAHSRAATARRALRAWFVGREVALPGAHAQVAALRFDLDLAPRTVDAGIGRHVAQMVLGVDFGEHPFIRAFGVVHCGGEKGLTACGLRELSQRHL